MTTPLTTDWLSIASYGQQVFVYRKPDRRPWRFTKLTDTGWKRTDAFCPPNQWLGPDQLATLNPTTTPPWKENPDDTKNT